MIGVSAGLRGRGNWLWEGSNRSEMTRIGMESCRQLLGILVILVKGFLAKAFVVFFHEWNEWKNPQFNFSSQDLKFWQEKLFCGVFSWVKWVKKSTIQLNNINHSFEWFWIMWKILFMKPLKIKPYLSRYIHEEIWHDICCHYFTNPEGNTPANSLPFFYRVKVKLCKNIIFLLHYVIIIVT